MRIKNRILLSASALSICATVLTGVSMFSQKSSFPFFNADATNPNSLVISSSNPSIGGVVKTNSGNDIWIKGDSSSGVNWDNGSGKIAISKNGYLQTLTIIHGIEKVKVEMVSGSVDLYHGYAEPTDLETPMYGSDATFTSSGEYQYSSSRPNRIRLRANSDSIIAKITIFYDCVSADMDVNVETLDEGLENSYIDSGTLGRFATTSFAIGEGNVASSGSKRSLKLRFNETTNNYVSLNTAKNTITHLAEENPSFEKAVLTLKAKFSDDVSDKTLSVCAIGSTWKDSTYIPMDRSSSCVGGWYSYRLDFSSIGFEKCDDIIRINIRPDGISSSNKDTAYVLLDDVDYSLHTMSEEATGEPMSKGLENMTRDVGMENVDVTFDNKTVFGRVSSSSLVATPQSSKKSYAHWFVSLSPQHEESFYQYVVSDFSKGLLTFDYKLIGCSSPSTIYLEVWQDWSTNYSRTVVGEALRDGWYRFAFDFSNLSMTANQIIRLRLGFDADNSKASQAKAYFDNIKFRESGKETYAMGLENLSQDGGMSAGVDRYYDYSYTASESSFNSLKTVLNGNNTTQAWQNSYGVVFAPTAAQSSQIVMNSGRLEAKFLFQGDFPTKKVVLRLFDGNWNGASIKDIITTPLDNGWWQASIDFSQLPTWPGSKDVSASFSFGQSPIRIGFGYQDVNGDNNFDKTVWVDDVFYYPEREASSFDMWQAYDTENIRRSDSTIVGREISAVSPLEFKDGRNGTDSSQLMIKARSEVASYNFRPGTLRSSQGDVITAANFEVLTAHYMNCVETNESGKTGHMGDGWYPDALIPIDKRIDAAENNVTLGNQQAIWVNCRIPKDQTPGTYLGNGILTINGVDYTVPMKVTVYNVLLSGANHAKTLFLNWYDQVKLGEGSEYYTANMRKAYYDFVLNRGISADGNYDWNKWTIGDLDSYDSFAENFATKIMPDQRVSIYRIPSDRTAEDITGYLSALVRRNIVEWNNGNHVNFFEKAAFYLIDEPSEPTITNREPEGWKNAKQVQSYIANAKQTLSPLVEGYPVIKNGLENVRNIMPHGCEYKTISGQGLYKDLLNSTYVDIPAPQFGLLNDASILADYRRRFDTLWFYGCVSPKLPYPSYHTDTPLLGQRIIPWMQYEYDIEGQLYFCTDLFSVDDHQVFTPRDVWNNPKSGSSGPCGDGQLVYPGAKYNVYGPITTLRLENIRNSYEDYELFYQLDHHLDEYNERTGSSIESAKDLINEETAKMFAGMTLLTRGHTSSTGYKSSQFESFRSHLLEQLEYCY
ncbi:MAG: DUF4091 domain-containing protein [Bacilli bacterium]|nr:DUF4091 domain-containing protein [Bacilli bacterium]